MRLLYHLWLSPFSRKIRVILKEKNLDFTMKVEKVWERRPEFLALNPAGEVPVLIEPDGTVLADAGAIAEFLDEVYRDKLLIGINALDRAELRRLTQWFDGKLNREVTEPLVGEKMMKRFLGLGEPNSAAIRAGKANLDYITFLVERRRWLRAIISRWPTSAPPRISRRSTTSATCPGTRMIPPSSGMRGSSRGRAFGPCSPTIYRARRRPSTTPISTSDAPAGTRGVRAWQAASVSAPSRDRRRAWRDPFARGPRRSCWARAASPGSSRRGRRRSRPSSREACRARDRRRGIAAAARSPARCRRAPGPRRRPDDRRRRAAPALPPGSARCRAPR